MINTLCKNNRFFIKAVVLIIVSLFIVPNVMAKDVPVFSTEPTSIVKKWYVDDIPGEGPDNPAEDFTSIQDAIDAANNGDSIFVYNGEYEENIEIDKQITLQGEDNEKTIITSEVGDYTIHILADNVAISNFNIIAEKTPIIITHSSYIKINDNRLSGYDLLVGDSFFNEITENIFFGGGIYLSGSDNNVISRNDLKRISLIGSDNNDISNNEIKSSPTGIITGDTCFNNIITYNVIQDCDYGIKLGVLNENTISYNDFISNKYMNAFILSSKSTWYHNYWDGTDLFPFPWVIPIPKIIIGYGMPKIFIDFDPNPALRPNL